MIDAATHKTIAQRMGASWIYRGVELGYPLCCINYFITTPPAERAPIPEVFDNTGFIPCPVCATKPEQVVAHINRIRAARGRKPFPNDEPILDE